jgi:hypothetical protein
MITDSEKQLNRKRFMAVMRRPIFFIVVNFFLINTLFAFLPYGLGDISYHLGRVAVIFYTGWLVVRRNLGVIRHTALAGAGIYFIDHVLLKGGVFLLQYLFRSEAMGLAAFSGVIVSFVVFSPLAMIVAAAGGISARSWKKKSYAGPPASPGSAG